jgi:thiol:disulfide interchange protein DsbD
MPAMVWLRRIAWLFVSLFLAASAAGAQVGASPHAHVSLVARTATVAPGATVWVAVVQDLDAGWHTYWRNPGDAGEATSLTWTLPPGWRAGAIDWPVPQRLPLGPIMNYGYEGRAVLPVQIQAPTSAKPGATAHLIVKVDYLVCAEVCVPGTASASLDLPVAAGVGAAAPAGAAIIDRALAATPQIAPLRVTWSRSGAGVKLSAAGGPLAGAGERDVYFYPYDPALIDQAKPQPLDRGPRGLTLGLTPGPGLARGAPALAGVLFVDGRGFEINAVQGAPAAGAGGLGSGARARASGGAQFGLIASMAYAFLGGVILNLMPCVFPILSMKAAALAGHGGKGHRATGEALAFLGGVIISFVALAGALLAARAAGEAVGWGFQLQSPPVVAALALIMLAAALNLSGLFEAGTSLQGLGSGLAAHGGIVGSALTGSLAVVVAAPCTAPFMGPALGFALTQPAAMALAVFVALGLGFAAPFTVLALTPALLRRLPRPGPWMEILRRALAFPMYGAAAWLAWVLAQQSGPQGLAALFAGAVALSLAAWLFGLAQGRRALGSRAGGLTAASAVALVAALAVGIAIPADNLGAAKAATSAGPLSARPWSPQAVAQLTADGHPVFVNFTAAWCVTCQVNERVAFSSPEVAQAFRRTGAAYLVADWTNRDGDIAKALETQGRAGVPLYLVYGARGGAPTVLPQLLTPQLVADAVRRAAS